VPDYGYYDWLFDPAFQPWLAALNFQIQPVTALSSGCPPDFSCESIFTDEVSVWSSRLVFRLAQE
jgi:hypothetical protein